MIQIKIAGLIGLLSFSTLFIKGYGQTLTRESIMDCVMGLGYTIHEDFELYKASSVPDKFENHLTDNGFVKSKDGHVKVFISAFRPITSEDSVSIARFLPKKAIHPSVNGQHIYQITGDIRRFYGYTQEEAKDRWREHVHYYPREEARRVCNADTLISYTLTLGNNELYQDRYKQIAVYYIQKHDRGNVGVYCFYDGEAEKDLEKYTKNVLGMFHYREPFTQKTLPERNVTVIGKGNQQTQSIREYDVLHELTEKVKKQREK